MNFQIAYTTESLLTIKGTYFIEHLNADSSPTFDSEMVQAIRDYDILGGHFPKQVVVFIHIIKEDRLDLVRFLK
jgi:hypothetical protein